MREDKVDPVTIIGKTVLRKAAMEVGCRVTYGMNPKAYLKQRMQLIIDIYDEHHKVTKEFVKAFQHDVSWEDIREVVEHAGVIPSGILSLASEFKNSQNDFEKFFSCPTYDFVVNYYYYTEELGRKISKTELDSFVNLARQAIRTI